MPPDEMPLDSLTHAELLREIAGNLRYLRRMLSEYEPLLSVIRGGGNAVRAAGVRRAIRKGTANAPAPAQR